jgi:hypothetical protein
LAGLPQSEIRDKVQGYFKAQLDQYLDWLDRRGLSQNALADVREEMLDRESYVDMVSANPQSLPVARFKRTMAVSDAEWDASLPRIGMELREGRRDLLRRVLEAAERLEHYFVYTRMPGRRSCRSCARSASVIALGRSGG